MESSRSVIYRASPVQWRHGGEPFNIRCHPSATSNRALQIKFTDRRSDFEAVKSKHDYVPRNYSEKIGMVSSTAMGDPDTISWFPDRRCVHLMVGSSLCSKSVQSSNTLPECTCCLTKLASGADLEHICEMCFEFHFAGMKPIYWLTKIKMGRESGSTVQWCHRMDM